MTTRRRLHLFAGVPDEMLRSIGLIAVLSARLDFIRMQILEEADQVLVTSSAEWPRRRLTDALISAFAEPLFEPYGSNFQRGWRRVNHSSTSATIFCIQ